MVVCTGHWHFRNCCDTDCVRRSASALFFDFNQHSKDDNALGRHKEALVAIWKCTKITDNLEFLIILRFEWRHACVTHHQIGDPKSQVTLLCQKVKYIMAGKGLGIGLSHIFCFLLSFFPSFPHSSLFLYASFTWAHILSLFSLVRILCQS
jgi:hypothetical protein